MNVYSVDKLIEQTRCLAAEFRATTGTMLPVSGEIARYDVARHLELELCESRQAGYDAIGTGSLQGLKIQVKSRVLADQARPSGQRIGQLNTDADWDLVALSIMDEKFESVEIHLASRRELIDAIGDRDSSRKKRGALSVAKFINIGELVWTRELGRTDALTACAAC